MHLELPDDVLYLICDQVRQIDETSGTLFNCALSGKRLAPLALASLYRHARSPGSYDELDSGTIADVDQVVMKWAIMWRSVYDSCHDKTLFPYALYLRFADLRDLGYLIEHNRFQRQIEGYFLKSDLVKFKNKSNPIPIVEQIGDAILSRNTLVEVVSGNFSVDALQRWASRLPRLRRLELWDGEVLGHIETQDTIRDHCPYFRELSIFTWSRKDADIHLGPFIHNLPANMLTELNTIGLCGIATQTCEALNRHSESLRDLHLVLEPHAAAVSALASLKGCTNLQKLSIRFTVNVNLKRLQPETFNQFSLWLGDCKKLKELDLYNIESAAEALVPMLLDEEIQLQELTIASPSPFFNEASTSFNYALTHQRSLTFLDLRGDGEDATEEQINSFVETIAHLVKLKKLELRGLMESFEDDHIMRLLLSLSQLEEVFTGGFLITDATIDAIGGALPNLKRWTVMALSRFSAHGLLSFINKLDEIGNDHLQLSVDSADPDYVLTNEEQIIVRSALKAKVGGTFDYMAGREAGTSDDEDYSD